MAAGSVTLLIENLYALAGADSGGARYPGLEDMLAGGKRFVPGPATFDHLRFELSGFETGADLPVAPVTRLADRPGDVDPEACWLRADPVTMRADLVRVFITGHGCADLRDSEVDALAGAVRELLAEEGMELDAAHRDRWYLSLPGPTGFRFTPIEAALGVDVAEVFPDDPAALPWRRLMNEIQMTLHAHPVNQERRAQGSRQINSVWFWGGGVLPNRSGETRFERVYSGNAVSRGLAALAGVQTGDFKTLEAADMAGSGSAALVDWPVAGVFEANELERIERFVSGLLPSIRKGALDFDLYAGTAPGRVGAWRMRKSVFWPFRRRRRPLAELLEGGW